MPLAAYLPDPDKWIDTSAASSSRPKQRPLTAFRHGLATPPTSDPRPRNSRASDAKSSSVKGKSKGSTRLSGGGVTAWLTPPTTSSQPRRHPLAQHLKETDPDSATERGSPGPSALSSQRPIGNDSKRRLEAKSQLGRRMEQINFWSSDEDDLMDILARPGPSRISSRVKTTKESGPTKRAIDAFSSGELTDLPPEYSTDSENVIPELALTQIPSSLKHRQKPPTQRHQTHSPATPVDDGTRKKASSPKPTGYTPPEHSPRLLTQPPLHVLKSYWSMNGLSSDRIGQGEEMWGRSKGWLENEERRKERELKKIEAFEMAEPQNGLNSRPSKAVDAIGGYDTVNKVKRILPGLEADLGLDEEITSMETGKKRERTPLWEKSGNNRVPLSPLRANVRHRTLLGTTKSPCHPPKGVSHTSTVVAMTDIPPPSSTGNPQLRRDTTTSDRHAGISITSDSTSLDSGIAAILEEARRDAKIMDEHRIAASAAEQPPSPRACAPEFPRLSMASRGPSTPQPELPLPLASPPRHLPPHHSITPPNQRFFKSKTAETLFALPPPPAPAFMSVSPAERRKKQTRNFKPVDVIETLVTWSVGQVSNHGGSSSNCDSSAAAKRPKPTPVQSANVSSPPRSVGNCSAPGRQADAQIVEDFSLAPTVHSQQFPHLVPSSPDLPVSRSNRTSSGWDALGQGILSIPHNLGTGPESPLEHEQHADQPIKRKRKARAIRVEDQRSAKQTTLQAFGIVREKVSRPLKGFAVNFEDEEDVKFLQASTDEEDNGDLEPGGRWDERPERVTANKADMDSGVKLEAVPDAPFHPDLRPAGIRAMQARRSTPLQFTAATAVKAIATPTSATPNARDTRPCSRFQPPAAGPSTKRSFPSTQPLFPVDSFHKVKGASNNFHRSSSENDIEPPLFSPGNSPARPAALRDRNDQGIDRAGASTPTTPDSTDVSSSLLTTTTEGDTNGVSEAAKAWWRGL